MDFSINAFKHAAGMPVSVPAENPGVNAEPELQLGDRGEEGNRLLRARLVTAVESLGGLGELYLANVRNRLGVTGNPGEAAKPLTAREITAVITEAELLAAATKRALVEELAWMEECVKSDEAFFHEIEQLQANICKLVIGMGLAERARGCCLDYLRSAMVKCADAYRQLDERSRTTEVRKELAKVCLFEARHVTGVAERSTALQDDALVLKMLNTLGGLSALAAILNIVVQMAKNRAQVAELLAKADALEAKADLAAARRELEEFIRELKEKIANMEKMISKDDGEIRLEELMEEAVADKIAASIEKQAEEIEKLVARFEQRQDDIQDEKRGIEA